MPDAAVERRFKVLVCGGCACQVLPGEAGTFCSCCGEEETCEIVVTAVVPLALLEAAKSDA